MSSQELQGVRSTGLNYNISVSRKYTGRSSVPGPVLPSSSLYTHSMIGSMGQGESEDQSDMAYECGAKQYQQVQGWMHGYGSDQSIDYVTNHQAAPGNDHQYMIGSFRSEADPVVVRNNSMVYADAGAAYVYGNTSGRQTTAGEGGYTLHGTVPCYAESTTGDNGEVAPSTSSRRSRPCSASSMGLGRRATAALNDADQSAIIDIHGNNYHGYDAGALGTYHAAAMDRGTNMYTTSAPAEEFGQGGSLRPSLPGYPYRYTDTAPDRGQANASLTTVEGQQYLAQGRGQFLDSTLSTGNDGINGRGHISASLQG